MNLTEWYLKALFEKVLVGGFDEEGNPDPYKLTFLLKGNQTGTVPNAKERYKAIQKEIRKGIRCLKMERMLTKVVDEIGNNGTGKMCSWVQTW